MIVALLKQKGGDRKTTLALHLAGEWSREGKRITLIDTDPRSQALDRSEQRARDGFPRLFGVIGLAHDTLHRRAREIARDADHVVIDGPRRAAGLARSALLAAELVLIPAQPSQFDGWVSGEMLKLIDEARIFRLRLVAWFVLNRRAARTAIARETAKTIAEHEPPLQAANIGQRVAFADAAQSGRLGLRTGRRQPVGPPDRRARQRSSGVRAMSECSPKRGFASRPGDSDPSVRAPEPSPVRPPHEDFSAWLTIDMLAGLRGRIKVVALRRGITAADMLHALLDRELPNEGGTVS